jgi:PadR family transcriptional regulator
MPETPAPILVGTLDLLILKTLSVGSFHGYGIAQHIKRLSREALRVEEGSLYPALQRMQVKGWITSELKDSPTGRNARYYKLTAAGRKQLREEASDFERSVAAMKRVLRGSDSPPGRAGIGSSRSSPRRCGRTRSCWRATSSTRECRARKRFTQPGGK